MIFCDIEFCLFWAILTPFEAFIEQSDSGSVTNLINSLLNLKSKLVLLLTVFGSYQSLICSLSRCQSLSNLSQEEGLKIEFPSQKEQKSTKKRPKGSPGSPIATIEDLKFSYSSNKSSQNLVLRGVNLEVKQAEKICLIGRTGCGKSTFFKSLCGSFWDYTGKIVIKGKELRQYNPKALRSELAIILQDTLIFEGTVKQNLDPKNQSSDSEVEKCLKRLDLWKNFESKGGLAAMLNSEEISEGERQLISLCRVMLRPKELVLLDESTSNIDSKTEMKIWEAIRSEFKDSAVLVISHRLHCVDFFDR